MAPQTADLTTYYVYIMASRWRVLYVGMTGDLRRRVAEHRSRTFPGFTRKYHVVRLVYFEEVTGRQAARDREQLLKRWRRERKVALIGGMNPVWRDLGDALLDGGKTSR